MIQITCSMFEFNLGVFAHVLPIFLLRTVRSHLRSGLLPVSPRRPRRHFLHSPDRCIIKLASQASALGSTQLSLFLPKLLLMHASTDATLQATAAADGLSKEVSLAPMLHEISPGCYNECYWPGPSGGYRSLMLNHLPRAVRLSSRSLPLCAYTKMYSTSIVKLIFIVPNLKFSRNALECHEITLDELFSKR